MAEIAGLMEHVLEKNFERARADNAEARENRADELCRWLEGEYGLGEMPSIRRKMYRRVASTVLKEKRLWEIFLAVVELSASRTDRGRYFARSITLRLAEALHSDLTRRFRPSNPNS